MLNCLLDTIQLWDECSDRTQPNYVDELPGISNQFLRDIARSQDSDLPELFNRLARNAARRVEEDLRGHLSGRMQISSIVDNTRAGKYPINPRVGVIPSGVTRKGMGIFYDGEAGLELTITAITIYPNQSGSITVEVQDALTGSVLATVSGTAVAGQLLTIPTSISVRSNTSRWGVFVSIPAAFSTYEGRVKLDGCDTCGSSQGVCLDGHTRVTGLVRTAGGDLSNRIDTGGISVDYGLVCDLGQYLCRNRLSFASIMRYAFGVSAIEEALYSDRVNNSTVVDVERLVMLGDRLAEKYKIALSAVVEVWKMPNDECFCNQPLASWKTQVP